MTRNIPDRLRRLAGRLIDRARSIRSLSAYPDKLLRTIEILARGYGWIETYESGLPIDAKGQPIPWFTYPAIEYLNRFDLAGKRIFEYGSGNSTKYWLRRGAKLWSVESDETWYQRFGHQDVRDHAAFLCHDRTEYVEAIRHPRCQFDVIVIDGVWREECAVEAPRHLARGGFIIVDNMDWYPHIAADLREQSLFQIDFSGFGPWNDYTWTTSLFVAAAAVDQRGFRDSVPIGGYEEGIQPRRIEEPASAHAAK